MESPSIACIGVIGKLNNPVHISVLPPHEESRFRFTLFLNSCLDIFAMREQHVSVDQDLGLLHAFDERFAAYGWLTNTAVKFVIIVDMLGKTLGAGEENTKQRISLAGLQESDLKPAFRALQTAYIRLLQNPFHTPSDDTSLVETYQSSTPASTQSMNKFIEEITRIGRVWSVGAAAV